MPSADSGAGVAERDAARARLKTGRNAPCPCGSGKKYKKCCLDRDASLVRGHARARAPRTDRSPVEDDGWRGAEPGRSPGGSERRDDEPRRSPEDRQIEALWDEIEAIERPSVEELDRFVDGLLALPAERTDWSEVLHHVARVGHPDPAGVFRRIEDAVPANEETGMGFLYWAAIEVLAPWGQTEMLAEIAARLRRLDGASYDADALSHVMDWLLAEGLEAQALDLAEHFLPIVRADDRLMPHAGPEHCALVFDLRAGHHLRSPGGAPRAPEPLAVELRRGMEEEIDEEVAGRAAAVIAGRAPPPEWTRAELDLPDPETPAWPETLRALMVMLELAREAWHADGQPPGCAFRGLRLLSGTLEAPQESRRSRGRTRPRNLLDCLEVAGMEERMVRASRDLVNINVPRARSLLEAHALLLRAARRHELIPARAAARADRELRRIIGDVRALAGSPGAP